MCRILYYKVQCVEVRFSGVCVVILECMIIVGIL